MAPRVEVGDWRKKYEPVSSMPNGIIERSRKRILVCLLRFALR
jgi:hypothetical protein